MVWPAVASAVAGTIQVTSLGDNLTVDGQCTLREAINDVNSPGSVADCPGENPSGVTIIQLPAGIIKISQTLQISSTDNLTLQGASPTNSSVTTIEPLGGLIEGFIIYSGASVSMTSLTLTNFFAPQGAPGSAGSTGADGSVGTSSSPGTNGTAGGDASFGSPGTDGGAIANSGTLTVTNVDFVHNAAGAGGGGGQGGTGGHGGTAYSNAEGPGLGGNGGLGGDGGAGGGGGAIANFGSLTVIGSQFTNNSAGAGGGGGIGGHGGKGGDTPFSSCTSPIGGVGGSGGSGGLAGAGGYGGAILNEGSAQVVASTFSSNSAGSAGNGGQGGAGGDGGDAQACAGSFGGGTGGTGGTGGFGGGTSVFAGNGGAIFSSNSLSVEESTLLTNSAGSGANGGNGGAGGDGGARCADTSGQGGTGGTGGTSSGAGAGGTGGAIEARTPTISRSSFIGNHAGAGGLFGSGGSAGSGGEDSNEFCTAQNGVVGANGAAGVTVTTPGDGGSGGAVTLVGPVVHTGTSHSTIVNSTFASNSSGNGGEVSNPNPVPHGHPGLGGGIFVAGPYYPATCTTCTSLLLSATTMTLNHTGVGAVYVGRTTPLGGGVFNASTTVSAVNYNSFVDLVNTIMASNNPSNCATTAVINGGHDINYKSSGTDTTCPGTNANPMLGTATYDSVVPTLPLLAGSAAIDKIPTSGSNCATVDARGVARPQGTTCDIGAVEHADAPVCTNDTATTVVGTPITLQLRCSVVAPLTMTYTVDATPGHGGLGSVSNSSGQILFSPATGYVGADSFTFHATTGDGSSNSATETVTMTPPPPTCDPLTTLTGPSETVQIAAQCHGANGLIQSFALVSGPGHGVAQLLDKAHGFFSYHPTTGYVGTDSFSIRALNNGGWSAPATVTVAVGSKPVPQSSVTSPTSPFTLSSAVTATYLAVSPNSAITWYSLRTSTTSWNGQSGPWTLTVKFQQTKTHAATIAVSPGHEYCFESEAHNAANVTGPWSLPRCVASPLDDRALVTEGSGWTRLTFAGDYHGTYSASSTVGSKLSRSGGYFDRVGVVVTTCPTCGSFDVLLNGVSAGTVNTHSATVRRQVLGFNKTFLDGNATVELRVDSGQIQIDGLGETRN